MSIQNWLRLFLLATLWGGSFFFIEVALQDVTPHTLVFVRVTLAAIALAAYIKIRGERIPTDLSIWKNYMVMGIIGNVIPFSLIAWGQVYITSSMASVLNATTPIFTVLLAHALTSDERLTINKICGVTLGFIGVYVMLKPTLHGGLSWLNYGQIAVIGAAFSYACAGVWGKRLKQSSPLVNTFGMLTCSSIVMLPIVLMTEKTLLINFQVDSAIAIIMLALLGTAVAYTLYFRILAEAGATYCKLATFLAPANAILLGTCLLGETFDNDALYGMEIIFAGLILIDGRVLRIARKIVHFR